MESVPLSPDALEARLRAIGRDRYHHRHPFHVLMRDGELGRGQIMAWALNRYHYQAVVPRKDAAILSRIEDPALRRAWRQRLVDQDGAEAPGGLARWLALTDGLGLDRGDVVAGRGVLPATRFAADAYLHFVRERPLVAAIASSLTELFAPSIIAERVAGMLAHYPFIRRETLAYFDTRLTEAPRDADFALAWVKHEARTAAEQELVLEALSFKCDVLWAMLDALHHAYVAPGHVPPGAFVPGAET
ncbi:pyrroloquinoline-quinone synthase PqqC [Polyangium spumosum]|uniref:Pyrroloquinoline-quinone synthase n=1 Tax=Polyangium spumosum TaxID=889282 RepID=A0A6N7Q069_9BACT|nr:pyrroloquinoline-quinone synthase PqqC [Polyangium spumosum]MRG97509.1 pyrroloquinoline-quinone synthase PqqC [Polyangium spumosum]